MLTGHYGGGQADSTVPDHVHDYGVIAHLCGRYIFMGTICPCCGRDRQGMLSKDTHMQYGPYIRRIEP
jgi:hypothetical protein